MGSNHWLSLPVNCSWKIVIEVIVLYTGAISSGVIFLELIISRGNCPGVNCH